MTEPNSQPPGVPEPDEVKDAQNERTKGKLLGLGSAAGCFILGTVPVSLFIIFGIGYYLLRGCS